MILRGETCWLTAVPSWVLSPSPWKNKERKENIVEYISHFRLITVNRRRKVGWRKKRSKRKKKGGVKGRVDSCYSDKVMDDLGLISVEFNKDSELLVRSWLSDIHLIVTEIGILNFNSGSVRILYMESKHYLHSLYRIWKEHHCCHLSHLSRIT